MNNFKIIDGLKVIWDSNYGYVVDYEDFLEKKNLEDNDYNYNVIFQDWLDKYNVAEAI